MPILLSRRKVRAKHQRTWWIIGVGSTAAACGAWLAFRARARAGTVRNAYPEAAVSPEITMPSSVPSPGDGMPESKSLDTLVPGAYAVPDAATALNPDSAFPLDASADTPPVGSVYSEPAPTAISPAGSDPGLAPVTGSGPQEEPWIHALLLAIEKKPLDLGYYWDHTHYIRIPWGLGQNS